MGKPICPEIQVQKEWHLKDSFHISVKTVAQVADLKVVERQHARALLLLGLELHPRFGLVLE